MNKPFILFLILLLFSLSSPSTTRSSTFNDFYDFLDQYEAANTEDKPTLIDEYIFWQNSSGGGFPAIINATHVVFIYYDDNKNITLCNVLLDIFEMKNYTMTRLAPNISFFYRGFTLKPSTRSNYNFFIDGIYINDPRNPYCVKSRFFDFPHEFDSEVALPPFEREFYYTYNPNISHGSLIPLSEFSSDPYVQLYLPPNYNTSIKYPVAYFGDGFLYTNLINASMILDNLIAERMLCPIIAVFSDWTGFDPNHPSDSNWDLRYSFYSSKNTYLNFLDNLVSYIDSHYSTIGSPNARLHVGLSLTGYASAYVVLERSSTFKLAAIQSGGSAELLTTLVTNDFGDASPSLDLKIWVSVGTYESNVEWEGNNLTKANLDLVNVCESKGWDVRSHLFAEGHSFAFWTHTLDELLIYFFPSSFIPPTTILPTTPATASPYYFLPVLILLFIVPFFRKKRI